MIPKVLQLNVHTYIGRDFVGELAKVNWAILPETRPGSAAATAAGGQAPVCAVHLISPMEPGTADNIAVVSWLFRALGGYDKRFALSFPNDFLARVQMVGTLSFACSPASGVDIPPPEGPSSSATASAFYSSSRRALSRRSCGTLSE